MLLPTHKSKLYTSQRKHKNTSMLWNCILAAYFQMQTATAVKGKLKPVKHGSREGRQRATLTPSRFSHHLHLCPPTLEFRARCADLPVGLEIVSIQTKLAASVLGNGVANWVVLQLYPASRTTVLFGICKIKVEIMKVYERKQKWRIVKKKRKEEGKDKSRNVDKK